MHRAREVDEPEQTVEEADAEDANVMALLAVFHEIGRYSTDVKVCERLIVQAEAAGVPDGPRYVASRVKALGERYSKAPPWKLAEMVAEDVANGKWRGWAAKRADMHLSDAPRRPAVEYEVDERTDDEIAEAAGAGLVQAWCEHFKVLHAGDTAAQLLHTAQFEGFADVTSWMRSHAILALRVDGLIPPPETT